jgi:hypothetical protein
MYALYLDHRVSDGGGFNASLQLIQDIVKISGIKNTIILTNYEENIKKLESFGWNVALIKYGYLSRFIDLIKIKLDRIVYYPKIIKFLPNTYFEKKISKLNIKHIVFVSPSRNGIFLRDTTYSVSIWDLYHRDDYHSKEIYNNGEWYYREKLYRDILPKAKTIFVDSHTTKEKILKLYQVLNHQIIVNQFTPKIDINKNDVSCFDVNRYIFYPAQYWAHKDHITLINSLRLLRDRNELNVNLICCGSDKGALDELKLKAEENNLIDKITFLNFVDNKTLQSLYVNCLLCVFPSKFGPTNLPPLEALLYGKRVILSDIHEKIEGVNNKEVIYFETENHIDLAAKILSATSEKYTLEKTKFLNIIRLRSEKNINNLQKWYKKI